MLLSVSFVEGLVAPSQIPIVGIINSPINVCLAGNMNGIFNIYSEDITSNPNTIYLEEQNLLVEDCGKAMVCEIRCCGLDVLTLYRGTVLRVGFQRLGI
jgi:Asp/Glu/hydantoin racemase